MVLVGECEFLGTAAFFSCFPIKQEKMHCDHNSCLEQSAWRCMWVKTGYMCLSILAPGKFEFNAEVYRGLNFE